MIWRAALPNLTVAAPLHRANSQCRMLAKNKNMIKECWACRAVVTLPTCAIPTVLGDENIEPSDRQLEDRKYPQTRLYPRS